MRVLYSGFDKLDVALRGALSIESLNRLRNAREEAYRRGEESLAEIGPGQVPMHVRGYGMRGGYAFITNTGPIGETWFFKDSSDPREWNMFVSVGSLALAVSGYAAIKNQVIERISEMGGRVIEESFNRVDYAVDVLAPDFVLDPDCVVAHSHSKVNLYWGEKSAIHQNEHVGAVFRGRRLESITIGKMPGCQIIIYNKRKEALEKSKQHWFKIWGGSHDDPGFQVWRVEFRAGKKELKEKWQIRTFNDLEDSIGDVFDHLSSRIRYVAEASTDTNVSRRTIHPLWETAVLETQSGLFKFRSGLTPDQVREIDRAQALANYRSQLLSHSIGLCIALGLDDEDLETEMPDRIKEELKAVLNDPSSKFTYTVSRLRGKSQFVG